MDSDKQDERILSEALDREGAYDAQLSLPLPQWETPAPFRTVMKRDGREERFDKRKIAAAIFKAAETVGGQDRDLADSLASAVMIYLGKRLGGQPPTVDQIHDAVERVLIHMAHAKTALAYARYRDRRARIRRLRKGDMRVLLSELEEARHEREMLGGAQGGVLTVRTSADMEMQWERERITEALVRETGLEAEIAAAVALEVEQQIQRAQMATLTTSLVRELVDAKLVEHGLEEYRDRHRRLGLPLYDSERIIRGTMPETVSGDPVSTDRVLARAVKKEYALAQVFSASVADAHLRGDIHLHHLGRIDRLVGAQCSLEGVSRAGSGMPSALPVTSPPRDAYALLAQMVKYSAVLQRYFVDAVRWPALNVLCAPFLHGQPPQVLTQFAQMLVYEYAFRALSSEQEDLRTEIGLCWTTPEELQGREAIGPDGVAMGQGYEAYVHTAQQLAWEIVEVFRKGGAVGKGFSAPLPVITLDEAFFKAPGHEVFLEHIAQVAAVRKPMQIHLQRGDTLQEVFSTEAIWRPGEVVLQQVSLNLPRAAYEGGKEQGMLGRLRTLFEVAVRAHGEKRDFIEGLLAHGAQGPLSLLAEQRGDQAYVDLDRAVCLISVEGLNECVQTLLNVPWHESVEAQALAVRVVGQLQLWCEEWAHSTGLRLALAQNREVAVGNRFAVLDARCYPKTAATVVKHDDVTQALIYTMGARVCVDAPVLPMERVRLEGELHPAFYDGAITDTVLPLASTSHMTIADFLRKAYYQTTASQIRFL